MSKQPSKRAIELRLEWLNRALGRPVEPWTRTEAGNKSNPGNFHLDHDSGGYRVEMMCEGGCATPIFGHARMNKTRLVDQLEAILVAIKLARGEEHGGAWPLAQKSPTTREVLEVAQATIERLQRHAPGSAEGTLSVIKQALGASVASETEAA